MDKEAGKKGNEAELRDAITTFEQILEAIPNDRLALETLSDAYDQLGDKEQALYYYTQLAAVILDEEDKKAAPALIKRLKELGGKDPDVKQAMDFLQRLVEPPAEAAAASSAKKKSEGGRRRGADITAELALAWNLVQAGELTQDEYSSVMHDLTESSTRNNEVPVTVLHVLKDRGFKNYERILGFLATNSGMPIVPLAGFELQKDANSLLPLDIMSHRGAIVFEMMGKEPLVAILNPYDMELKKLVEETTARKCHFYLTAAEDYDKYLETVRKAMTPESPPAQK